MPKNSSTDISSLSGVLGRSSVVGRGFLVVARGRPTGFGSIVSISIFLCIFRLQKYEYFPTLQKYFFRQRNICIFASSNASIMSTASLPICSPRSRSLFGHLVWKKRGRRECLFGAVNQSVVNRQNEAVLRKKTQKIDRPMIHNATFSHIVTQYIFSVCVIVMENLKGRFRL